MLTSTDESAYVRQGLGDEDCAELDGADGAAVEACDLAGVGGITTDRAVPWQLGS